MTLNVNSGRKTQDPTSHSHAKRVLFIAPFEPWCRENGSSVVISDLLVGLDGLLPEDSLHLTFVRNPPGTVGSAPPTAFPTVTLGLDPLPKWISIGAQLLLRGAPWEYRLPHRKIVRLIERQVRDRALTPDVVHVEHLVLVRLGRILADAFECPLVYRAHNIESQLWGRRLRLQGPLRQWLLRRYERSEAEAIALCDTTLCISTLDREWVHRHLPGISAEVLPVGLTFDRFATAAAASPPGSLQLCFVGGLDWAPNEAGLRWFVETVLPYIVKRIPSARLSVLARGAANRSWLTSHPHITIMQDDFSPAELFASSCVSIAPLLDGGGIRVKILESLAAGCGVVATSIGGEGLSLPGLTHVDDPLAFANACVQHLEACTTRDRKVVQSRVQAVHGADVIARQLAEVWQRLGNERSVAAGGRLIDETSLLRRRSLVRQRQV